MKNVYARVALVAALLYLYPVVGIIVLVIFWKKGAFDELGNNKKGDKN